MTDDEKLVLVQALTGEEDDEIISAFLTKAAYEIYNLADPGRTTDMDSVLAQYGDVQVDIAAYRLNKRGWDYQVSHSENGVTRSYETGDLPDSILRRITPKAWSVS